jgi:hypothetical protein
MSVKVVVLESDEDKLRLAIFGGEDALYAWDVTERADTECGVEDMIHALCGPVALPSAYDGFLGTVIAELNPDEEPPVLTLYRSRMGERGHRYFAEERIEEARRRAWEAA